MSPLLCFIFFVCICILMNLTRTLVLSNDRVIMWIYYDMWMWFYQCICYIYASVCVVVLIDWLIRVCFFHCSSYIYAFVCIFIFNFFRFLSVLSSVLLFDWLAYKSVFLPLLILYLCICVYCYVDFCCIFSVVLSDQILFMFFKWFVDIIEQVSYADVIMFVWF